MPDPDAPSRSEASRSGQTDVQQEARNLPVPVRRPSEVARERDASWIGRLLRTLFGWRPGSIRDDLEFVLEDGASGESGFSPEERTMLKNILGLRERRTEDVMVPRADIVAVQQDIGLGELLRVFEGAGHSRLVVYNDTLDDPVGMVHIRDLLAFMTARSAVEPAKTKRKKPLPAGLDLKSIDLATPLSSTKLVRPLLFVPPSMPAIDLLARMQATHIHLALVIDEYGGTDGLVSIEDIVEEIVGEIEDEHDEATNYTVVRQPDGSFIADARASLEDVILTVGADFDVGDAGQEVDTLGGYLVAQVGRVPVRGELVPGPAPFEIEVLDADPRRVKKVKISIARDRRRAAGREREARRREAEAEPDAARTPPAAAPAEHSEGGEASNPAPDSAPPDTGARQP